MTSWAGSEIQSLLFRRDRFSPNEAKAWARRHGKRYDKLDTTERFIRLRQKAPRKGGQARTITLTDGVEAVVTPKGKRSTSMAAPKGKDGRKLGGAALVAYRRKRGQNKNGTPRKRSGGGRRPSGPTTTAARRAPTGSRAPGIGTVIGTAASVGVGGGAPVGVDYLAKRFLGPWTYGLAATTAIRGATTALVGLGFWLGTSTQRGKAAFAAPAIAAGIGATFKPAAQALLGMARPGGMYVSEAESQRQLGAARPSGMYVSEENMTRSGSSRYA